MDRYVIAARQFVMRMEEEDGHPLEKGTLHVSYVGAWRGYRLYDSYIDGRLVDPRYPPIYIMVDANCNVRWMTDEESWEYVKEKDMRLMMEEYAKFDNKKKYEQIYEIQGNGSNRGSMPDGSGLQTETQGGVAGD